jgi:hypothetical protein
MNIVYSKNKLQGTSCYKSVIFLEWCMTHCPIKWVCPTPIFSWVVDKVHRQVVKLYFPKYIDKVVIIEIKQTCHTVWLHWEDIVIQFGYTGWIFQYVFICFKNIFGFRHCLDWRNGALEMVCRDNHPPFFVMWPKVHFRVMSSKSTTSQLVSHVLTYTCAPQ